MTFKGLSGLMALSLFLFIGLPAMAEAVNADADGLAVHGYDPVAYFSRGEAVPGRANLSADYGGARYRFADSASRDAFLADPEAYLPAFGGYCAWAVGQGYAADVDPEAWTIHNGRLYLNYNRSISRRFRNGLAENIMAADANWPTVKAGL